MAENDHQPISPSAAMRRLEPFVGTWRMVGRMKLEDGSEIQIGGTDIYEWLPGEYFLIHRVVDVHMGEVIVNAIEIIGYDAENHRYVAHAYDNQGNIETMSAFLDEDTWIFSNDSARFTGSFSNDGEKLKGRWDRSADGVNWKPWMDITLLKQNHVEPRP